MTVYSFWIFDRHCNCVYAKDWQRARNSRHPLSTSGPDNQHSRQYSTGSIGVSSNAGPASQGVSGTTANGDFIYRKPQSIMQAGQMLTGDLAVKNGIPMSMTTTQAVSVAESAAREAAKKAAQTNAGLSGFNHNEKEDRKATSVKASSVYNHQLFDNELGKLIFGLVFSLRSMSKKLAGTPSVKDKDGFGTVPGSAERFFADPVANLCNSNGALSNGDDSFVAFSTSKYKLHYYETPSNIKFVLVTDPTMDSQVPALKHIYSSIYLEYAVKNPLFPIDATGSAILNNDLLVLGIESHIASLPNFE